MGVDFDVVPSEYVEQLDDAQSPEEVAKKMALGKALDVAKKHPNAIVVGSDTVVTIDGKHLEKPKDLADAKEMLKRLSGRPHLVTTGVAVVGPDGSKSVRVALSRLYFKPYDEAVVDAYVATGDPLDKAGGYGIQSGAAVLMEKLEGNVDTVIGLPTHMLADMLQGLGIDAKSVDYESPIPQAVPKEK